LTERFAQTGEDAGGAIHRNMRIGRGGRWESSLVLVAPVAVRAEFGEVSGTVRLEFLAAPAFNLGDGFQLDVFLTDSAEKKPVYSRYFDPGRKASDRDWIPIEVSLDLAGRKEPGLELRVSAGPQGDLVADWLALARVRLVHTVDSSK